MQRRLEENYRSRRRPGSTNSLSKSRLPKVYCPSAIGSVTDARLLLCRIIWNIHGLITEHLGRSLFDRVFSSNKDAATISGFQRKLAKAQEDFMVR